MGVLAICNGSLQIANMVRTEAQIWFGLVASSDNHDTCIVLAQELF